MADNVPVNKKNRKPTKKKSFSLDDFKKKIGNDDVGDKPLHWYKMSKAFHDATGLPGMPKGYVGLFRGFSNTGKSTAVCEALVSAQKDGALPVIIDTENNLGRTRLELMGFDFEKPYIHIDNEYLLENFGKLQDKNRNEAAIEDLAEFIKFLLHQQDAGELPFDLFFGIDSIGTLDCIRTVNAQEKNTTDNNMWNAGAYEKTFKYLLNNTIPNSRKKNKEFTNTLVAVQKIWIDNMGNGVVKHKGGETFFYGCRIGFHFGGIAAHSTKVISATSKKREVAYGTETKISVFKNQIDGPLGGISLKGEIMSMPHGFIFKSELDQYKKDNIQFFRDLLEDDSITADEIKDKFDKGTDLDNADISEFVNQSNNEFNE